MKRKNNATVQKIDSFNVKKPSVMKNIGKGFGIAFKIIGKFIGFLVCAILTIVLICLIAGIIVGCAFAIYVSDNIDPTVDEMLFYTTTTDQTTTIYYYDYEDAEARQNRDPNAEAVVLKKIYGTENSLWASIDEIPDNLENAFIAIEDKRFRTHDGVDWRRTAGAVLNFFIGFDESSYGGSTITQQLIKNVTGDDETTIQRKVEEILRALNLEKTMEKDQILELYLNIVPLSQNCIGVRAAAETYFGKELSELTLTECAALASITKYPTKYDPFQHPDHNKKRRIDVLDQMLEQDYITSEEFDAAAAEELVLRGVDYEEKTEKIDSDKVNSWYIDTVIVDVREDLMEKYGISSQIASNMINSGGLSIYTLMDPEVQTAMEEVFLDEASFPESNGPMAEAAMAIVDPYTGDLLGVVGGRGEKQGNLVLNYATQTKRAPGSSIKPLSVYAPALEEGIITYGSVYDDTPLMFNGNDPYPKNLPDRYKGLTTINSAVERSVNTVAMKVLQDLTIDKSFEYLTKKLGFDYLIEYAETADGTGYTDKGLAALALGQLNFGVTVRDIASAYTAFPTSGKYSKCYSYLRVEDSEGNVLLSNEGGNQDGKEQQSIVFSEQTAYIMTRMLYNVVNAPEGTARKVTLREKVDVAGKTGTAGNDYDRWFVGYTPYYVGAVWYGYSFPEPIGDDISNPSVTLFDLVMTKLHEDIIAEAQANPDDDIVLKTFDDRRPVDIVECEYCKDSGKKVAYACTLDPRKETRTDVGYFTRESRPVSACDTHIVVEYDVTTNAYAHEYSTETKEVALIKENTRSFPKQIVVWDAQYVYRELPDGVKPCGWWGEPYFRNTIPEGTFVGVSRSEDLLKITIDGKQETRPFNMFSYQNYTPPAAPAPEETTQEPSETIPPSGPENTQDEG